MSSRPGDEPRSTGSRPTARRPGSRSAPTAINPINGEQVPIFIADYVLSGYGTGAIMAVPAHDERDFVFAQQFGLPIRRVVAAPGTAADDPMADAYVAHAEGERLVNSGPFDGMPADDGGKAIVAKLAEAGKAEPKVTYRLRDWLISRQRYWGTPIPIIYCETDGIVPVPDADLPVRLPENVDYKGRGDNPLNHDEAFLRVDLPALRRTGATRDRHDGHVRRFVVVLVPLPVARLRRRAGGFARWPMPGPRSTSTRVAPSTP